MRLQRHQWVQLFPGVYLVGSGPPTWLQRQYGACLAAGPDSSASHRGSIATWQLDGYNEGVVELTTTQTACPRPKGVVLHRTLRWDDADRRVHRLVPVTSINRSLIDYGAVAPRILVERAVEDAIRRGLTNEGALRRRLAQIGGPGCRGSGVLRWVLDNRPEGRPARSGFEVMLLDVIREYGLPMPVRNYPVVHNGIIIAELDLAYLGPMIDLEAKGAKWHSTRRQVQRDQERCEDLRSIGWTILDFDYDEVVRRPEVSAGRIRAALCASTHRIGR
ncbi:MAG: hypothetical protein JO054_02195 [Actinobacteria bacterium]|nr:hypothetical protein [Actinomycetota bacterium]